MDGFEKSFTKGFFHKRNHTLSLFYFTYVKLRHSANHPDNEQTLLADCIVFDEDASFFLRVFVQVFSAK